MQWGNVRVGGSATAELDRDDFDVDWNRPLESGGWLVGRRVQVELSVEAILLNPQQARLDRAPA